MPYLLMEKLNNKTDLPAWELTPHERVMIIAPHPDDEVLAAGGMIATALKLHNQISVVVATNGDASYATALWYGSHVITKKNFERQAIMRQRESLNALASLGVGAEQVHFWGFPDRGLAQIWKGQSDNGYLYRSPTTGHDHSTQAVNSPVMTYTSNSLDALFENEFSEFRPTMIIMPHPDDNHSDHSALANFTLLAVKRLIQADRIPPALFAYWMWRQHKPWLTGARPQNPAQLFIENDPTIREDKHLMLSHDLLEKKMRALQHYPSQKIAAGKIFRETSQRTYEAFTPLQLAV